MQNKTFDPTWLVEAARAVEEEYPWLPEALGKCTEVFSATANYIYFLDPVRANKPGSIWQFETSITLEDTARGNVVLDIVKDQRVGGVELLSELNKQETHS